MNEFKLTWLGRLILIPSIFLFLPGCVTSKYQTVQNDIIVDSVTDVIIYSPCGTFVETAKIDTGADGLSIDETLAEKMCLEPFVGNTTNSHCPNGQAWVTNAMGGECRDRFHFNFSLGGIYIEDRITTTNKKKQRQKLLIGNRATAGKVIVRPLARTNTRTVEK